MSGNTHTHIYCPTNGCLVLATSIPGTIAQLVVVVVVVGGGGGLVLYRHCDCQES